MVWHRDATPKCRSGSRSGSRSLTQLAGLMRGLMASTPLRDGRRQGDTSRVRGGQLRPT